MPWHMNSRCALAALLLAAATLILSTPPALHAQESKKARPAATQAHEPTPPDPSAIPRRFLAGLRERGYYDLAAEFIQQVRDNPDSPPDLKVEFEYEAARNLINEAVNLADIDRRFTLIDQARARLEAFINAHPGDRLTDEARAQVALLAFQRGMTSALLAADAPDDAARNARRNEARASYQQALTLYDQAIAPLQTAYETFPSFIPDADPRHAQRDRIRASLFDAELSRALVDYELAQLEPPGSDERAKRLETARLAFQSMSDRRRGEFAGFFAHAWEGKCLEEKGELGPAMGVYKDIIDQPSPALADIKRKVMFFQIVVDGKRGDHPLAVERAAAWLQQYPQALNTLEGFGVRLEMAKSLVAQLPDMAEAEKPATTRRAADLLAEVVRVNTPYKPEAVDLLRKIRPNASLDPNALASLTYDNALGQAQSAVSTGDFALAAALFRQAIRRADPARDPARANQARLEMARSEYQANHFDEAAVLAQHVARRYPQSDLAPQALEIALAALAGAYNRDPAPVRITDLDRLVNLAQYAVDTWPKSPQADAARMTLGQVALGRGLYRDAAETYEAVGTASKDRLDALVQAGDARWRLGLQLRAKGQADEADAQAKSAQALLEQALAARRDANTPLTDPGLVANLNALAEIHRASSRPRDAIALLQPAATALGDAPISGEPATLRTSLLTILLRSHIADNQTQAAQADLAQLRKTGGDPARTTQLLFELSHSLQKEIDAQASSPDPAVQARVTQARQAYATFLTDLAASRDGQTFDSLAFAAESLLALGKLDDALSAFDRILTDFAQQAPAGSAPDAPNRLLRIRLRKAETLRRLKKFSDAQTLLDTVKTDAPRALEPMLEQGYLLEDWAQADPSRWKLAYAHWRNLSTRLQKSPTARQSYYDAVYHVALALRGMGQKPQAASTLRSVMTLAPSVGNPETKARYETLLKDLGP
jgi:TolA-binding protein